MTLKSQIISSLKDDLKLAGSAIYPILIVIYFYSREDYETIRQCIVEICSVLKERIPGELSSYIGQERASSLMLKGAVLDKEQITYEMSIIEYDTKVQPCVRNFSLTNFSNFVSEFFSWLCSEIENYGYRVTPQSIESILLILLQQFSIESNHSE